MTFLVQDQRGRHDMKPEVWLRGPIEGVEPLLMPVAHALQQAREDMEREVPGLSPEEIWLCPGGAASMGFHLQHIGGSTERLLTYAQGHALTEAQRQAIALEKEPGEPLASAAMLLVTALDSIDEVLAWLRTLSGNDLLVERFVGRARLPSTTLGLLFHIAEHTTRHVGQLITTKKIVQGLALAEAA